MRSVPPSVSCSVNLRAVYALIMEIVNVFLTLRCDGAVRHVLIEWVSLYFGVLENLQLIHDTAHNIVM